MRPVEIDIIGAEAPQRPFQRGVDMLRAIAAGVRTGAGREAGFGGDDEPVAQAAIGDDCAQHLLAPAAGVHVSGIDHIPAGLDIGVEYGFGRRALHAPARNAEGHRAQGERADDEA